MNLPTREPPRLHFHKKILLARLLVAKAGEVGSRWIRGRIRMAEHQPSSYRGVRQGATDRNRQIQVNN
jgi:hypothetical protein